MPRLTLRAIAWTTVSALLALPALAQTASEAGQDIPITDPGLLEVLGFESDATNVYATPRAIQELLIDPAERAVTEQVPSTEDLAALENLVSGAPYGTATAGFSPIDGIKFLAIDENTVQAWHFNFGRYCISGPTQFVAQFEDLPHGAKLENVRYWYYDASNEDVVTTLWRACQPDSGPGEPSLTLLGSSSSSGSGGYGTRAISTSVDIDAQSCVYYLTVRLDEGFGLCSEGADLAIIKARARWFRQIGPAPATATFDDVPTTHPFFQHIEALAASGITSGCDGDSFCPSAPLTRGQMAVFLAKALGLHWGSF